MHFIFSILFSIISFVAYEKVYAANQAPSYQQQMIDLDQQIKQLEDERDKYRAKAARARDQGDRLQFENGMLSDARRYWKIADACDEIADKIDEEIKVLNQQKSLLQQEMETKN